VGGDHPQQELADFGYIPKEKSRRLYEYHTLSDWIQQQTVE
jgi:hypothetical protein